MKLNEMECVACEGGTKPLEHDDIVNHMKEINGLEGRTFPSDDKSVWDVVNDKLIEREFKFKDFKEALAFVNKVGAIAESEGHHPDITIFGWNKVSITLFTHSIGGLSINDFVVAAKINKIRLG